MRKSILFSSSNGWIDFFNSCKCCMAFIFTHWTATLPLCAFASKSKSSIISDICFVSFTIAVNAARYSSALRCLRRANSASACITASGVLNSCETLLEKNLKRLKASPMRSSMALKVRVSSLSSSFAIGTGSFSPSSFACRLAAAALILRTGRKDCFVKR